jgi:hypothetical protein
MKSTAALTIAILFAVPAPAGDTPPPFIARWQTSASFQTKDADLQRLHDAAVRVTDANRVSFTPSMEILVEGGGYNNAWIETQPMGGEMIAKRNPQVALNNQVVFMLTQRTDGRLPGMVISGATAREKGWDKYPPEGHLWMEKAGILADFEMFQGFCFAEPAWRMYHWMGRDKAYLQKLHDTLVAYDAYLWRARDTNNDGLLETWCVWDTGEDAANRYHRRWAPSRWPFEKPPGTPGLPLITNAEDSRRYWFHDPAKDPQPPVMEMVLVPFASMDVMSYSYSARATLALISEELGNGHGDQWRAKAEDVRRALTDKLWDKERHACFDRDRLGRVLPELIHNNLRCMWHGIFTQDMADAFIRHHLINPQAFWTPVPLVSVAINEPIFENAPGNNWSGQPQGLTYQRAIQALERYGHFAEVTLLAEKLLPVLIRNGNKFAQQLDPVTGRPSGHKDDGYGPMALAALEYLSRTRGIHLDVENNRVWWSCVYSGEVEFSCTQRWGEHQFEWIRTQGKLEAKVGGKTVFIAEGATRIVTDLGGRILELHGIAPEAQGILIVAGERILSATIAPNAVLEPFPDGLRLKSRVPFTHPEPFRAP